MSANPTEIPLLQIRNLCLFKDIPPEMTRDNFDFAAENYFAVM